MRPAHSLLLLLALTGACKCTSTVTPPPRPPAVPAAAVWAGGLDGGAWILCKPQGPREFDCTIYGDSGDLWAQGRYRPSPADAASQGLHFSFFDGEIIGLANDGFLEPVSGR